MDPRQPGSLAADLTELLETAVRRRAMRNELRIAYFRAGFWWVIAFIDIGGLVAPDLVPTPSYLGLAAFDSSVAVMATMLCVWLRRGGWTGWLSWATSGMDLLAGCLSFTVLPEEGPDAAFMDFWARVGIPSILPWSMVIIAAAGLRLQRGIVLFTSVVLLAFQSLTIWWFGQHVMPGVLPDMLGPLSAILLVFLWLAVDQLTLSARASLDLDLSQQVLSRFLPATVVDGARLDPIALVSKPRFLDVTVMVTDLRGFTTFSEGRPPEEILDFLNRVQSLLAGAVREHGGMVDKFLGDGMLAIFGAPDPLPDHAARAVAAARKMRVLMAELRKDLPVPVKVGMGLHCGPVVVGVLGGQGKMEFTALGDAVNTASRLESMTKEHGVDVLMSGDVVAQSGATGVVSLGVSNVRGKSATIELWTLAD